MNSFLKAKPTKFFCFLLSFLMLTLNLPDLSSACWTVPGPGCLDKCPICPDHNHIIEPTGNVYYWIQVLSIPGKGIPLTVDLVYNSNGSAQDGSFGYGWSLNYDIHIVDKFEAGEWDHGAEGGHEINGSPYLELYESNGGVKIFDLHSIESDTRTYRPRIGEYETISWNSSTAPYYIRELKNVIERALITCQGVPLSFAGLVACKGGNVLPATFPAELGNFPSLNEMIAFHIRSALKLSQGRVEGKEGAAELLGLHPSTLRAKMRKHGIRIERVAR